MKLCECLDEVEAGVVRAWGLWGGLGFAAGGGKTRVGNSGAAGFTGGCGVTTGGSTEVEVSPGGAFFSADSTCGGGCCCCCSEGTVLTIGGRYEWIADDGGAEAAK